MSSSNTIHSRSNKNIGDIIEEKWEITGKRVIAEPVPADRNKGIAPRLGIYEYEVKPIVTAVPPSKRPAGRKQQTEPNVGGTRREAGSVPLTVRRIS